MYRRPNSIKKTHGFTLIEVILALAIFASVTLVANQVLKNILTSSKQTEEVSETLKQLQRALVIMDSDFRQILARRYRNGGEEPQNTLIELGDSVIGSDAAGVRFVRGGWVNPQSLFPRGEVVKVGYRLTDETLERVRWMYPDDSSATEPAVATVLDNVSSLSFEVFDDGEWKKNWDKPDVMPSAIRIKMTLARYGDIERVYLLPAQTLPSLDGVQQGDIF
ncbi:type II secretion system minor pseudopilin GspJ [Veronia pacifica]|uniref:Type II secretion system protein J n=1 Tax=Veronia pacifica TaxID=1080227 RepID=A0A1C3EJR5_9GAMM|nr:type II secretion system minor pseudopilin GspJ [Veronia pacifica]ODA33463.1 type II secretion system protein GspJ [Veronia pacifica]